MTPLKTAPAFRPGRFRLSAQVSFEGEGVGVFGAAVLRLAGDEPPLGGVPLREAGVAGIGAVDPREVEFVSQRQCLGVDLRAADDEDLLVGGEQRERLLERVDDAAPLDFDLLPRDDDVRAVGQRPSE